MLKIPSADLRKQVAALETLLCLRIFRPGQKKVELTDEGQFLIKVFREAVASYERQEKEWPTRPDG